MASEGSVNIAAYFEVLTEGDIPDASLDGKTETAKFCPTKENCGS